MSVLTQPDDTPDRERIDLSEQERLAFAVIALSSLRADYMLGLGRLATRPR